MLDYNYLEPLALIFEDWNPTLGAPYAGTLNGKPNDATPTYYTYKFDKKDNGRIPSFVIRRVVLNRMAGGPSNSDEVEELVGCVCKSATFARSAGSSQVQVTMSGFYANESMILGNLPSTDYKAYAGHLVEYSCLFIDDEYVANTESLAVSIDNSAEAIYNVCSPFAKQYVEGITNYTFSTTAYSNDPSHYKQRVYSGGQTMDNMPESPMCKGMAPLDSLAIKSMNKGCDTGSWSTNWSSATMNMEIDITKCVIKSLQWQSGDGSKLQDSISSAECQGIAFTFRSEKSTMSFAAGSGNVNIVGTPVGGVVATGVSIPATMTIAAGQTAILSPTISPSNASSAVTWSSAADAVATVSDYGLVTGVAQGTANITVNCGTHSATCVVTVTAS